MILAIFERQCYTEKYWPSRCSICHILWQWKERYKGNAGCKICTKVYSKTARNVTVQNVRVGGGGQMWSGPNVSTGCSWVENVTRPWHCAAAVGLLPLCAFLPSPPYLIFVIFSPHMQSLVQYFSTQMCVNPDKKDFATKRHKSQQYQFLDKTA